MFLLTQLHVILCDFRGKFFLERHRHVRLLKNQTFPLFSPCESGWILKIIVQIQFVLIFISLSPVTIIRLYKSHNFACCCVNCNIFYCALFYLILESGFMYEHTIDVPFIKIGRTWITTRCRTFQLNLNRLTIASHILNPFWDNFHRAFQVTWWHSSYNFRSLGWFRGWRAPIIHLK